MIQFNLEAAKLGSPVCTNIGEPVEIIKYDYHGEHPIIAIVNQGERQVARLYDLDGKHRYRDDFLMMASVKHEGWTHIYKRDNGRKPVIGRAIFATKEEAMEAARHHKTEDRIIDTIYIEWEE